MSLSRYYKRTDSFQQEQMVKGSVIQKEGWKPLATRPPTFFVPQSEEIPQTVFPTTAEPDQTEEQTQITPQPEPPVAVPEEGADNADRIAQQAASETAGPDFPLPPDFHEPAPSSPQPEIDLSQYIAISEAQQQMESAYQEGLQNGIKQAEEDYGSAVAALNNICTQLNTLQETIIRNSSGELLEFALAITDRILRFSVANQDKTIVATIEEALQRAIRSEEFTIYLHPEDMDIVRQKSGDIVAGISGLDNILLKSDPAIERGGARLESDNCTIDATIASQFETIRDEILKAR